MTSGAVCIACVQCPFVASAKDVERAKAMFFDHCMHAHSAPPPKAEENAAA